MTLLIVINLIIYSNNLYANILYTEEENALNTDQHLSEQQN